MTARVDFVERPAENVTKAKNFHSQVSGRSSTDFDPSCASTLIPNFPE
jgi:hypothetical protein